MSTVCGGDSVFSINHPVAVDAMEAIELIGAKGSIPHGSTWTHLRDTE